jgi:hypothetical protein
MEAMLQHIEEGHHVVADCLLDLRTPFVGVRRDKKLDFPIGRVRTVVDSPEILYLLSHPESGRIHKVVSFIPYRNSDVGFRSFVRDYYAMKESYPEDSYQYRSVKLTLNTLYGKLGQRYYGEMSAVDDEEYEVINSIMDDLGQDAVMDNERGGVYYRVGDRLLYRPGRSEEFAWHSMPRIPAKVCSMARIRLQGLMDIAGSGHFYNCDTDSLIVDHVGLENLERAGELGDGLGKLGIVTSKGKELTDVSGEIFGNKDYVIAGIVKRKGVKKDAIEVGDRIWEQREFVTGMSSYWKGDRVGVRVRTRRKDLNTPYDKGIVMPSGWVEPLVFEEW